MVAVRGAALKRALRVSARVVSGLLALGVGVIAILLGFELIGEGYELANAARERQGKSGIGLLSTSPEDSTNLRIVANISVVLGIVLIAFGMLSWWKPSVRLGVAMLAASPCMLLPVYIALKVWPVPNGFIFGPGDALWIMVILATAASGIAGGLLTASYSRWTSVDGGTR